MSPVSNPPIGLSWTACDVEKVAMTPGAAAWTDIDCSATVGGGRHLVILRVTNPAGGTCNTYFRTNGETEYTNANLDSTWCEIYNQTASTVKMALAVTDANGIIEYYCSRTSTAVIIDIVGYL